MTAPHLNDHLPPLRKEGALGRGRPSSSENRKVRDDIILAAEDCLVHKSPQQITIKEIAKLAGTRPSMIQYYFGGLSGVLNEILRRGLREIQEETNQLREAILRNEETNPLRAVIATFATSFNRRPAMTRIMISEMLREDSNIRKFFVEEWPASGKLMMDNILGHLAATGYYRKDINIDNVGAMIRSVVFYPIIIQPYLARESQGIAHYLDDQWIDFVTTVFECYLKPPGGGKNH